VVEVLPAAESYRVLLVCAGRIATPKLFPLQIVRAQALRSYAVQSRDVGADSLDGAYANNALPNDCQCTIDWLEVVTISSFLSHIV
jgi:hypothetical protein